MKWDLFFLMYKLDKNLIAFPDPAHYHPPDGLLAFGGDLSAERIRLAYENGIFPWYNPGEEILWWCPDPRFVLYPDELRISKSMKKVLRDEDFTFTENHCFRKVLENCMRIERPGQEGTWLNEELIETFTQLHHDGLAKSVEVWQKGELVGGFYGIRIGNVFCGESMFSHVSNASKAGFIHFVNKYRDTLELIDCQIHSEHLESLGARMIPKSQYLNILKRNNEF